MLARARACRGRRVEVARCSVGATHNKTADKVTGAVVDSRSRVIIAGNLNGASWYICLSTNSLGQNHEESGEENSHVESFDGTLKDRDENRESIDEHQFSALQCVITAYE